jgi:potassium-transporting ATPase KdpC subunit
MQALFRSVVLTIVLFAIVGVGYPLAGWALSQAAFRGQADGSLSKDGSALIGQPWGTATYDASTKTCTSSINPMWFNGRPDNDNPLGLQYAAKNGTCPMVSGESTQADLGPRSQVLVASVAANVAAWRAVGVANPTPDLVTSSGSELDPDLTPQDALVQVPMVAKARGIDPSILRGLIAKETVGPELGFLGASYVNVLALDEALAALRP